MSYITLASRLFARGGGVLILISAFLISIEIVLRQTANVSIIGVDELSGYALAIGSSWSFASALIERAHVRIDSLYGILNARLKAALDLLGFVALGIYLFILIWYAFEVLTLSMEFKSTSITSFNFTSAIPQALWLGGLIWFFVVLAVMTVRIVAAIASGDIKAVSEIAGVSSVAKDERAASIETGGT